MLMQTEERLRSLRYWLSDKENPVIIDVLARIDRSMFTPGALTGINRDFGMHLHSPPAVYILMVNGRRGDAQGKPKPPALMISHCQISPVKRVYILQRESV